MKFDGKTYLQSETAPCVNGKFSFLSSKEPQGCRKKFTDPFISNPDKRNVI